MNESLEIILAQGIQPNWGYQKLLSRLNFLILILAVEENDFDQDSYD